MMITEIGIEVGVPAPKMRVVYAYPYKDMDVGEILNPNNIRIIRPGAGLKPKYYDLVMGKKIKKPLKKGTPLTWDDII